MRPASRRSAARVGTRAQLGDDVVEVEVGLDELVDSGVAHLLDDVDEVVHRVAVDRDAEAVLGLDLVPVGDGDVAHVVAEPGHPQLPERGRDPRTPAST